MELSRKNWPLGWIPSDNAIGGRKDGLLRMDNLYLDDQGIVKLVPGLTRVNSTALPGTVHSIYSQTFGAKKIRFVGLSNGSVKVAETDFSITTDIITGGNPEIASFATMYGMVFASSGKKIVSYNIESAKQVGLNKPTVPVVTGNVGPNSVVVDNYNAATMAAGSGTILSTGTDIWITTASTVGKVLVAPQQGDTTVLTSGSVGAATDRVQLPFTAADSSKVISVLLEFHIDDLNYYVKQWTNVDTGNGSPFNVGINAISVLSALRGEFDREGSTSALGWESITEVILTVEVTEVIDVNFQRVTIHGGSTGTLSGPYQYKLVSVSEIKTAGITNYIATSPASDATDPIYTHNSSVNIYFPINHPDDFFVTKWRIYRRSAVATYDINPIDEPRRLDQWYQIAEVSIALGQYEDILSDAEAIEDGKILDEEQLSIVDVGEEIVSMVAGASRMWYLTSTQVIPSKIECPDSYSPFQAMKLSGNSAGINLWIVKALDGSFYVGTTEDVYRIVGEFVTLEDGTLSASIFSLGMGTGYQPISRSCTFAGGKIYYISGNGPITIDTSSVDLLIGDTELLYRKTVRHEFPFVNLVPNGLAIYAVCVTRSQVWWSLNMSDGTRRIFVYDFNKKYWHVRNLDPISLFVEDDGTILGGFGGGSGNFLNVLDSGTDLAGINGQNIHFRTVCDDFDAPNQRKDVYTLRIWAKSDVPVSVEISVNGTSFLSVGSYTFGTANGGSEYFIELPSQLGSKKNWAVQFKANNATAFELYGYQFEFDSRPPQQNYMRIAPTNQGSISRKRWMTYAIVIDSLGSDFTITPYVDNVASAPVTFSSTEKLTAIYYFLAETVGTDISAVVKTTNTNNVFEYYGPNLEETVSEKLPPPSKYFVIPSTDYGNPNRKRHSSYKFTINTRGAIVRFTPRIDGINKTPITFSTSEKRTQPFFFTTDNIGIDIGGILESVDGLPFEFYGVIVPQDLEIFPPQLKEFRIPESNFGIPARKRVRTLPLRINTNGTNVTFTPIVDGITQAVSVFNTTVPTTVFHYFSTDIFGIDFAGEFVGEEWFEFYGMLKPEEVEVLPVGKKFDQVGPAQFDRIGKLLAFRIRGIFYDTTVSVVVYVEDVIAHTFVLDTIVGVSKVYEQMQMPKTIAGTAMRFEIGPSTLAFHRYSVEVLVNYSGMQGGGKWMTLK